MNSAPIQLRRYVPEHIVLEVNPAYREEDTPPAPPQEPLTITPELLALPSPESPRGELRLTIGLNENAETYAYYRMRITLWGEFDLVDPEPPDQAKLHRYFLQSALSLLFGIARALFFQICAASPYPRLMLPVMTFEEEVDELLAAHKSSDHLDVSDEETES